MKASVILRGLILAGGVLPLSVEAQAHPDSVPWLHSHRSQEPVPTWPQDWALRLAYDAAVTYLQCCWWTACPKEQEKSAAKTNSGEHTHVGSLFFAPALGMCRMLVPTEESAAWTLPAAKPLTIAEQRFCCWQNRSRFLPWASCITIQRKQASKQQSLCFHPSTIPAPSRRKRGGSRAAAAWTRSRRSSCTPAGLKHEHRMQRLKGNLSTGSIFLQQADVRELRERQSWQNPALPQHEARWYCCF